MRVPEPIAQQAHKWKYIEPAGDKGAECAQLAYGTRRFAGNDYRGIKELVVTGSSGVIYSKKYDPARETFSEIVQGIKPGKYKYAAVRSDGGREELCFEVVGLNAAARLSKITNESGKFNFEMTLDVASQNGLVSAELFAPDMSSRAFSQAAAPELQVSLRPDQLPFSYLLQLTDKAGFTVQKEIIVKSDGKDSLKLWEGENSFSAAVVMGDNVKVRLGPWLTATFNKVSDAGNIVVDLFRNSGGYGGKVLAIPRIMQLSGGAWLAFDKASLTFNVEPKGLSSEQMKRLSVHQLGSERDYPSAENMLPAKLDLENHQVTVETNRLGRYVLLVPGYKNLRVLKSKKMVAGRPEAEVVSPLDIELIEAPRVTVERIWDIPAGARLISQAYGFKTKSSEYSAPTDVILRFDPKTKPCHEKERPNLRLIHFGMSNYTYAPESAGNDLVGERYGELSDIDQLGFLVALACLK